MSKQYLAGTLSPKENFQIESQLLENDFYFEAMEGLEMLPWKQCEQDLQQTESRLKDEFGIDKSNSYKSIALAALGLFAVGLLGVWYFTTSTPKTVDLTAEEKESVVTAPYNETEKEELIESPTQKKPVEDSTAAKTEKRPEKEALPPNNLKAPNVKAPIVNKKKPQSTNTVVPDITDIHITVGRIVDTKGLAVPYAIVTSGAVTDTTDTSGYYALKIPQGGTRLLISHLGASYKVDVDTNQNWEIILDIAKREVHDYLPINAANRFK